ncbi:MAG: DUF411 domain-containing protein [Balneolaceae bacterium]|jgi:hypothetical protein
MKTKNFLIFLGVILTVAGILIWNIISNYYERQETAPQKTTEVVMYKNPGCECCDKWASYMQQHGYKVSVNQSQNMPALKTKYGVPGNMESCHTALIGGYIIEGHVPIEDINRLLKEQPAVIGIAAPGMPASSPGMNTAFNKPYNVYLFNDSGSKIYARH